MADPRSISDEVPITYTRYRTWIIDNHPSPCHLDAFIPTNIKHIILRLRCTSFPLAIQAGRLGKHKIPRSQRRCKACNQGCVEDEKHFLIECPLYTQIRHRFPDIFRHEASVADILNYTNQGLLGKALAVMLQHRKVAIWAPIFSCFVFVLLISHNPPHSHIRLSLTLTSTVITCITLYDLK